jgi:hypothetical protein
VIGTPAVDHTCSRFGQWVSEAAAACAGKAQPASSGRQVRCGIRQSIPSSSIDNCARLSTTIPSSARGQTNRSYGQKLVTA